MVTTKDITDQPRRGRPRKDDSLKAKTFSFCVPADDVDILKKLADEHNGLSNFIKYAIEMELKAKATPINPAKMSKQDLQNVVDAVKALVQQV